MPFFAATIANKADKNADVVEEVVQADDHAEAAKVIAKAFAERFLARQGAVATIVTAKVEFPERCGRYRLIDSPAEPFVAERLPDRIEVRRNNTPV